jgi:hypothetical protein
MCDGKLCHLRQRHQCQSDEPQQGCGGGLEGLPTLDMIKEITVEQADKATAQILYVGFDCPTISTGTPAQQLVYLEVRARSLREAIAQGFVSVVKAARREFLLNLKQYRNTLTQVAGRGMMAEGRSFWE